MAKNLIRCCTGEAMGDLVQGAKFRADVVSGAASRPVIRAAGNGPAVSSPVHPGRGGVAQ